MADDPNEHWFSLALPDGSAWDVVRAHFTEAFSELFECVVEAASTGSEDPQSFVGKKAVFAFGTAQGGTAHMRYVPGIVAGVIDRGWMARRRVAEFRIVPRLWLLGQTTEYRIFQDTNALQIVLQVLDAHGLYRGEERSLEVPDQPQKREYCTQYGETDLAFIKRLLEEEGLGFMFAQHWSSGGGDPRAPDLGQYADTLVIGQWSKNDAFPKTITDTLEVVGEGGAYSGRETIRSLEHVRELVATGNRLIDYDFTHATQLIDEKREAADENIARTIVEYPGRVTLGAYAAPKYGTSDARKLVQLRRQEAQAASGVTLGRSDVVALGPGQVFDAMREGADAAEKHLVLRATHRCEAPEVLQLDAAGGRAGADRDRYVNQFESVPPTQGYRPARVTPKPRALTPQSAVVVPEPIDATDPICTDVYGRVKVRFQWDRRGERPREQAPKNHSCWIRTTQLWAGNAWGFVFLPRVGMEVLVQFLDADPDRPVVTGCLYNSANKLPEELPANKTKSIIRTQNAPDGAGYNELSFEDHKDSELVYLRAQKDLSEKVFNDHKVEVDHDEVMTIGNDQTLTVKNDRKATVEHDDTLEVTNDRRATITGMDSLDVDKDLTIAVLGNSSLTVAKNHNMSIDENMVVKVGGNSGSKLEMSPSSIKLTISGTKIEMSASALTLQCGGSKIEMAAATIAASTGTSKLDLGPATAKLESTIAEVKGSGMTTVSGAIIKIG